MLRGFGEKSDVHGLGEVRRDFLGESDILLCQSILRVSQEGEFHRIPPDIDIGMVVGRLRKIGNLGDESDGCRETFELSRHFQLPVLNLPFREVLQGFLQFCVWEDSGHGVLNKPLPL